jgi:hypothetical protein
VLAYDPAPGQFVNHPQFNDPARALGPPVGGGTAAPGNLKQVSLGGFGGFIVLGFDSPVLDLPPTAAEGRNPRGLDLIIFGNAFWAQGNPQTRFAEPATIEVSADANGNGLPDDPWYLIPGSHLAAPLAPTEQLWDDAVADPTHPPASAGWIPAGATGTWATRAFALPPLLFAAGGIVPNPAGPDSPTEGLFGYADCSPTMALPPGIEPERFYTRPDDPFTVGITPGSGGGDAVDIAWAVDPATGAPAGLAAIDFVRITTAVNLVHPLLGEVSAEVGGVARVIVPPRSDWNDDGRIEPQDVAAMVNDWFADLAAGTTRADFDGDGAVTPADIAAFVAAWFAGT